MFELYERESVNHFGSVDQVVDVEIAVAPRFADGDGVVETLHDVHAVLFNKLHLADDTSAFPGAR